MFFFFYKQKTAYEMRISDWSSDVCSSDLVMAFISALGVEIRLHFQLVMFGLGRGDGDVQALDPRPFPGPTREAMRRGRRIGFGIDRRGGVDRDRKNFV